MWVLQATLVTICLVTVHTERQMKPEERSISLSVASMAELLQTERNLIEDTRKYIDVLQKKVDILHSFIDDLPTKDIKNYEDIENYLSIPINSFGLIRRTQMDMPKLLKYFKEPAETNYLDTIIQERVTLPTNTDLWEATEGLQRIQDIYKLSPIDIAKGHLGGKEYGTPLSTLELFTMGVQLFKKKRFFDTALWLNVTLHLDSFMRSYEILSDFDISAAYELYVKALINANRGTTDALKALQNAQKFYTPKEYQQNKVAIKLLPATVPNNDNEYLPEFKRICALDFKSRISNLHCRYNTTFDPYYLLAPFKMEELSLDPYIVLYYDVLSDSEIDVMLNRARSDLTRAEVVGGNTIGDTEYSFRTVQNAWIFQSAYEFFLNRTSAITGFDKSGFEEQSIMNYGIGGHYLQHCDYFQNSIGRKNLPNGDRIATALFYLSDVELGGATGFPKINLKVSPQKGTLLHWYNLKSNGDGDNLTLHAACPVISGSKWVSTIWIREEPQFRIRPCYNE